MPFGMNLMRSPVLYRAAQVMQESCTCRVCTRAAACGLLLLSLILCCSLFPQKPLAAWMNLTGCDELLLGIFAPSRRHLHCSCSPCMPYECGPVQAVCTSPSCLSGGSRTCRSFQITFDQITFIVPSFLVIWPGMLLMATWQHTGVPTSIVVQKE